MINGSAFGEITTNSYVRQREFDAYVRFAENSSAESSAAVKELGAVCASINLSLARLEDRQNTIVNMCKWMTTAAIGVFSMHLPTVLKYIFSLFS